MERNSNSKYLNIEKKKDLPCGSMSVRNRFTYYPLYDVDKNSYIRRYQLWVKYRDKCIKEGREYVDVKQYGKILNAMSLAIKEALSEDQDGVIFKSFKIKVRINYNNYPVLQLVSKLKKKGILSIKNWGIAPNRLFKDKLRQLYKQNKLIGFLRTKRRHFKTIADKLDIFDDF